MYKYFRKNAIMEHLNINDVLCKMFYRCLNPFWNYTLFLKTDKQTESETILRASLIVTIPSDPS